MSRSRRRSPVISAALALSLAAAPTGYAQPPSIACGPGDNSAPCVARRLLTNKLKSSIQPPRIAEDLPGKRYVPPAIIQFLWNRKIDPQTRAFLFHVSAKQTEDWTLAELQMTTQLVPILTETAVPTRVLSDFYEFLGLDPTSLFEPQLGQLAQAGTGFDARNPETTERAQCLYLLGFGENFDLTQITIRDLSACTGG